MSSKVGLAMAAYNQAEYIREALDCIRAQTCSAFELIVVDDESTDGTLEWLQAPTGDVGVGSPRPYTL